MQPKPQIQPTALPVHPDATTYSGMSRTRLYALMDAKEIEAIKVGRRRLILRESIDAFIARQPRAA